MKTSLFHLTAIGIFSLLSIGAKQAGVSPVETGRVIAQEKCTQCHAIGLSGESPLEPAPPFRRIFKRYLKNDVEAFTEGLAADYLQMPPFAFSKKQIEALFAYIKSFDGRGV